MSISDGAVRVEEGELGEGDDVFSVVGVALCEDGHAPGDDAAGLVHQLLDGVEALAGGDYVVYDEDAAALYELGVRRVYDELLYAWW